MKKEVFVERAVAVHGDKFDYSLVPDEVNWKDKVPVLCETHGQFLINAGNHISNKRGCPSCAAIGRSVNNRDSLSDVKKQIATKHPNLLVDYENYTDKCSILSVRCSCANIFEKSVKDLLRNKYSCYPCSLKNRGLSRRKPFEDFLAKAKEVHGDRYNYSRVDFVSFSESVEIVCETHGSFYQTPTVHIKGHGCKACAVETTGELKRKSLEDAAPWVFSDPEVTPILSTYLKATSPMSFVCNRHGEFSRMLNSYKTGYSICKECNVEKDAQSRSSNTESFIEKAKQIFPDYDYSRVAYTRVSGYVDVVCEKGHSFSQRAGNLLQGYGCPSCSKTGFSYNKKGSLYVLKIGDSFGKIGITHNLKKRLAKIRSSSKHEVSVIRVCDFDNGEFVKNLEQAILKSGIEFKAASKHEVLDGYTETFWLYDLDKIFNLIDEYKDQLS